MKNTLVIYIVIIFALYTNVSFGQNKPYLTLIHDDGYDSLNTLAYSPDGCKLVTGTVDMIIWDAATGEKIRKIPGEGIGCISISNDGSMIAYGRTHLIVRIVDFDSGKLLFSHEGSFDPTGPRSIDSITFTPKDDRILFIDQYGKLNDWDYANDKIDITTITNYGAPPHPQPIQFFHDFNKILYGATIISLSEKIELYHFSGITIITNQNQMVSLVRPNGFNQNTHQLIVQDYNTYEKISESDLFIYDFGLLATISPNGRYVLVGKTRDHDEETRIIDAYTGKTCRTFQNAKGEDENIDQIVFSPNGKQVALVSGNRIKLYDVSDLTSSVKEAEALGR